MRKLSDARTPRWSKAKSARPKRAEKSRLSCASSMKRCGTETPGRRASRVTITLPFSTKRENTAYFSGAVGSAAGTRVRKST